MNQRRVLNKHHKNNPKDNGPSWLTFIGHMKDSLWSVDLFRCESIHLKTHWVMVVYPKGTGEIKSVPHVPTSHPFIERLIGSVRRELLDRSFF